MRYFLDLAYNGSPFHGWQSQPNASSVQATIEEEISKLLGRKTNITGAGRTDTGVHARQMFVHFDYDKEINDEIRFLQALNSMVGKNIVIRKLLPVPQEAHARFDANERTYKYFVSYSKNPFLRDFSWFSPAHLSIDKMNAAASCLLTTYDFTSFAKLHSDAKTNICDVRKAEWKAIKDDIEAKDFLGLMDDGIVFTITADRFLRNMVRAIVGTLVDVGRGKLSQYDFMNIINEKNRCSAGISMPANALFLWKITYPYL